jgi:hypothetical protein
MVAGKCAANLHSRLEPARCLAPPVPRVVGRCSAIVQRFVVVSARCRTPPALACPAAFASVAGFSFALPRNMGALSKQQ